MLVHAYMCLRLLSCSNRIFCLCICLCLAMQVMPFHPGNLRSLFLSLSSLPEVHEPVVVSRPLCLTWMGRDRYTAPWYLMDICHLFFCFLLC